MVDTSDEWITARTGIKERHIAADGQASSDLAYDASIKALDRSNMTPDQLDMIIVATVTPDAPLPSTSCILQDKLKAVNAGVVDIVAACSGFIYGLQYARALILTGAKKNILVIGVETLTRITNWKDRNTCVLFGDAAGAAVVSVSDEPGGILNTFTKGDGSLAHLLQVPYGACKNPINEGNIDDPKRYICMEGPEVFKSAVKAMGEAATTIVDESGIDSSEISLMIPHQANIRIIEATAKRLKLPMDRVYVNIHKYGNTSAASIPIALDEAVQEGRINSGDKIVLVAFGAGFTWGSALIEW
jgi:3-oxoacyl-[acyl-carrier-protein] synthase-3